MCWAKKKVKKIYETKKRIEMEKQNTYYIRIQNKQKLHHEDGTG